MDLIVFRKHLIHWFKQNSRPLPWRKDRNWYRVWISETMLQQTQVAQVIPYYERFVLNFPDVGSLAAASLESVLKLWEGLGYYARARNLHQAARIIVDQFDHNLPQDITEVRKLPGFGPYTSNAVLSIAFNKPFSAVDGNVTRIITRLLAIDQDIRQSDTRKAIIRESDQLLDMHQPAVFNEALMELGAMICTPRNPRCNECPVSQFCLARQQRLVSRLPFKSPLTARPSTSVSTYIAFYNSKFLLAKRPVKGLLGGLWEFPSCLSDPDPKFNKKFSSEIVFAGSPIRVYPPVRHIFTHFNLQIKPVLYRLDSDQVNLAFYSEARWLPYDEIGEYPMHRSMQKLLEQIDDISEIVSQ